MTRLIDTREMLSGDVKVAAYIVQRGEKMETMRFVLARVTKNYALYEQIDGINKLYIPLVAGQEPKGSRTITID